MPKGDIVIPPQMLDFEGLNKFLEDNVQRINDLEVQVDILKSKVKQLEEQNND